MKTYQQFILEATTKSDKLTGRLKMLYNLPSDKERYFKQQNPPVKKAVAQVVDPLKSGAIGGRTTFYSGTLKDKEHRLKKLVGNLEKVGILHGGTKGSDLYDRLP